MSGQLCEPVLRPFVGDVLERLDANQMEAWQERSAILEFEAGFSRALAEALALLELLLKQPTILKSTPVRNDPSTSGAGPAPDR
jgi:hypothetical protein